MNLFNLFAIPIYLIELLLVGVFSLLIGLARRKRMMLDGEQTFGTDRTHTLLGIFGFVCYQLDTKHLIFWGGGGLVVAFLLGLYYLKKHDQENIYGMTSIFVALITYCFAPLLALQPYWLSFLILVFILLLLDMKEDFAAFSAKFSAEEFIILSRFILMAGVILPLLPNQPIFDFLDLRPYTIWLSVVAISGISYFSYLLRKFVFSKSGIVLSGALGGLYSSTATTIIMAKRSATASDKIFHYLSATLAAITVMYGRVIVFCLLFNISLASHLLSYLFIMVAVCGVLTFFFARKALRDQPFGSSESIEANENPLEIKFAIGAALFFVAFSLITHFALQYYGNSGLYILSWVAGIADIDPFLITMFQNTNHLVNSVLVTVILQAVVSNNILKGCLAIFFAPIHLRKYFAFCFAIIVATHLLLIGWLYVYFH